MTEFFLKRALPAALCLPTLIACTAIDKAVRSIPTPKLPEFTKMIPGGAEYAPVEDPEVPFQPQAAMMAGHTLELRVYSSGRSPAKLFSGTALVDAQGVLQLGDNGSAKVGGRSLAEAVKKIESVFRIGGRSASQIYVHVLSVEGTRLVSVAGDVRAPQYFALWDDASYRALAAAAGGRTGRHQAQSVYLIRDGGRMFYRTLQDLDEAASPKAGDMLFLSPDL